MFVRGSVSYDEEEATFIAVAEDGQTAGELFVKDTIIFDEKTPSLSALRHSRAPRNVGCSELLRNRIIIPL